jgi:glycosyltransferase involved in cell wall biosynthesis
MITLAKSLGLSVSRDANTEAQVIFAGSIKEPEVYMQGAIAFLLTSKHEGLPTVLIQAAALSLPFLASDCQGGGVQYLLEESLSGAYRPNKMRGFLLPIPDSLDPTTLDAWAQAMERVDSDELYQDSMKELSSKISQHYSRESAKAAWLTLVGAISNQ